MRGTNYYEVPIGKVRQSETLESIPYGLPLDYYEM